MTQMPHLPGMSWDENDQLQATYKQVVGSGTPETTYYTYDAQGQRARKVTENQASAGNTPTRKNERLYLGGWELYRTYNTAGSSVELERESLHVMDDQQRIVLVETKTIDGGSAVSSPSPVVRVQLEDHLGSCVLEVTGDSAASVITYEEHHPFGTSSYRATNSGIQVSEKRYRYTGKERDEENSLTYHGARYYAPWLGRWTAADPGGMVDGPNLYAYVGNQPIIKNDPTGQKGKKHFMGPPSPSKVKQSRYSYRLVGAVPKYMYMGPDGRQRTYQQIQSETKSAELGMLIGNPFAALSYVLTSLFTKNENTRRSALYIGGGVGNVVLSSAFQAQVYGPFTVRNIAQSGGAAYFGRTLFFVGRSKYTLAPNNRSSLSPRLFSKGLVGETSTTNSKKLIEPVNGLINVGGATEKMAARSSNLNPILGDTGGGTTGIPNLVKASFSQMSDFFQPNSASLIFSSRLPYKTVNWEAGAKAAYKTLKKGGKLEMNVWIRGVTARDAHRRISEAFKNAGFKKVEIIGNGPGTMIITRK